MGSIKIKMKIVLCLFFALILAVMSPVHAEELIIDTDVTTPSNGCSFLGIQGSYVVQAKEAINRINEIRLEACQEGVKNPNTGEALTTNDYVPIKWSSGLEYYARIRAAESALTRGHVRTNGNGPFTVNAPVSSWGEVLAWNTSSNMLNGIGQWYREKEDWVNETGKETGHYTQMIDPTHTYVGLATFLSHTGSYYNTTAGEYSYKSSLDETVGDSITSCIQKLEVKNDYIKSLEISGENTLDVGESLTLDVCAKVTINSRNYELIVLEPTWSSSDETVATVSKGKVTAKKAGTTTITVSANGLSATCDVTVKSCAHSYTSSWKWTGSDANGYTGATVTLTCSQCAVQQIVQAKVTQQTSAATCESEGNTTYTAEASYDGVTYTDRKVVKIPAAGHTLTHVGAKEATETDAGNIEYWKCSVCHKYFSDAGGQNEISESDTVIPATGHIHNLKKTAAVSATCTKAGNTAYWSCTKCGKYYADSHAENEIEKDSWIIPATGHDYGDPDWNWTGSEAAQATFTCAHCHEQLILNATVTSKRTEPTCTKEGSISYSATVVYQDMTYGNARVEKLTALGHNYRFTDFTWTPDGSDYKAVANYVCQNDQSHTKTVNAVVTSQKMEPTCIYTGRYTYTAVVSASESADCQEHQGLHIVNLDMKEHELNHIAALAATETTDGHIEYWYCTQCQRYFRDAQAITQISESETVIPAIGHIHNLKKTEAVAPTCTKTGNSAYWNCTKCGKYFADANAENEIAKDSWIIPTASHTLTHVEAKAATETTDGHIEYWRCSVCHKYFRDAKGQNEISESETVIPATGHTHSLKKTEAVCATCIKAGNSAYWSCTKCGKYYADANAQKEIAKNSWIISATGHKLSHVAAQAATATTAGHIEYWHCSTCDEYFSDAAGQTKIAKDSLIIPATGEETPVSAFDDHVTQATGEVSGADFLKLKVYSYKMEKTAITLKWTKNTSAKGYIVYGQTASGSKKYGMIKTITKNSTVSYKVTQLSDGTALKKGTYYKFVVIAYKNAGDTKSAVTTSQPVYITTTGGSKGNYKKVKSAKSSYSLKKGKTATLKITTTYDKKPTVYRKINYVSSKASIATVSTSGKITAKKKGTCYIYAYSQNGLSKKIKVTVK